MNIVESTKLYWNSMNPIQREEFLEKMEERFDMSFGKSNSKCTWMYVSKNVAAYAVDLYEEILEINAKSVVKSTSKDSKTVKPAPKTPREESPIYGKIEFPSKAAKTEIKVKVEKVEKFEAKADSLDLLIVFDDTGSMSSVRKLVRQKIDELTSTLFKDIDNLRIAVMILNDYCDAPKTLLMQDFSTDAHTIKNFVHSDSPCGGGDSDECYELALHRARQLNWQSSNRALVIIADANPHPVGYRYGGITYDLDWKKECAALAEMGVQIYSVQALGSRHSTPFYEQMARITNGIKLELTQFDHVETYIKAIAYRQNDTLENYENSDPQFKTNLSLKNMFRKLKGMAGESGFAEKVEFLSKYQVMKVENQMTIRDFVEMNGCTFKKGNGYYSLIPRTADGKANSEIIQSDKLVIFVDKETGEVSEDTVANRKLLGIPYGTKATCRPLQIPDVMNKYEIFIQSNSYNRNLDEGTRFLYRGEYC